MSSTPEVLQALHRRIADNQCNGAEFLLALANIYDDLPQSHQGWVLFKAYYPLLRALEVMVKDRRFAGQAARSRA